MAEKIKPPIKWAGGKSQILSQLEPLFPETNYDLYIEPFFGGGAVFFQLLPEKAVLIDNNEELINFFRVLRDRPQELLESLDKHENTPEYYYSMREVDTSTLDNVSRASRFLYLNKTGYNGLYRVNKKGKFNVPYGKYKNPNYKNADNLLSASRALKNAEIIHGDFSLAKEYAENNTFIYFDPPYFPLSETANFTGYTSESFKVGEQDRLAGLFRELDKRGCMLMLSNSDTPYIRELYEGYDIREVYAKRAINCRSDRRGAISELVIRNYTDGRG